MRNFLALCGAVLLFSVAAEAQDGSRVMAGYSAVSSAASPQRPTASEFYTWQVSVSYEYVRLDFLGSGVNLNGFNTSLTRFANNWFGLEADVGPAFGSNSSNQDVKFLWYGGGPHLARRGSGKFEPWVHGLFGGAHLFPQTALGSRNAFGYEAGGGVDIKLNPRVYGRIQGDFVGTHFFDGWQKNGQVKVGLVLNF
jgi:opacity protein-like surface antigen